MGCSQSKASNAAAAAAAPPSNALPPTTTTDGNHRGEGGPSGGVGVGVGGSSPTRKSFASKFTSSSSSSSSPQPAALYYHLLCGLNPIVASASASASSTANGGGSGNGGGDGGGGGIIGANTTSFWEDARSLCVSHPELASYVDPNTLGTPLHVACSLGSGHANDPKLGDAALSCLRTIVSSCPGAASHRDRRGHVPLDGILASMSSSGSGNISGIGGGDGGDEDEIGGGGGGVMSCSFSFRLRAARLLLEHDARSVVLLGKVLYQVVESLPDDTNAPLGPTVEFVDDESNRLTLLSDGMDDDVLALLYRRFVRQFDQSERFFEGDNSRSEVVRHREIFKNAAVNTFNIIEILMRRHREDDDVDDDDDDNLLVHNAVRAGSCPPDLLRYIVETNLDMVAEPDSKGNLPLHYAAGRPDAARPSASSSPPESYSKYVIDELLYAYPEGAGIANADGALPITLAVESGKKWIGGGIRSLHEAYPEGIEQIGLGEDHPLASAMSFRSIEDEVSVDQSILEGLEDGHHDGEQGSIANGVDGGGGRRRKRKQRRRINKDESHDAIMFVQRPGARIRDVVSTMWANEEDGGVQMLGCSALELAATTAASSSSSAGGGGGGGVASVALLGVTAVVNAMKNHPNEPAVQEKACSALRAMAPADGEREVSFAASGAISSIVSAMQAHVSDATVQREACGALRGIASKGGAERATVVASVSGFTALVNALAAHPRDRSVQREACRALGVLTSFRDAYLPELHEQTEMLLQSAAENFPDDCSESKSEILFNLMRMRSV